MKAEMLLCWVLYKHCPRLTGITSIPIKHEWRRVTSLARVGHVREVRRQVANFRVKNERWGGGVKDQNVPAIFQEKLRTLWCIH